MTADESFEEQIRDVLSHLYDYPYLQTHPLVDLVEHQGIQKTPKERMRSLRRIILEGVEEMSPGPEVPYRSLQARGYTVLNLRFVECHTIQNIAQEIGISERQLYRDSRRAEEDLAKLVWNRFFANQNQTQEEKPSVSRAQLLLQEAKRSESQVESIPVAELVQNALQYTSNLSDQKRIHWHLGSIASTMTFCADRMLARQVLVNTLSFVIKTAAPDSTIELSVEEKKNGVQFGITFDRDPDPTAERANPMAAQELIKRFGGYWQIHGTRGHREQLSFSLMSQAQAIVLLVDDNQGLEQLFTRYLPSDEYSLIGATSAQEGLRLAETQQPNAIVLDVMMPRTDGWQVLQQLKKNEKTRHIPVIVCSVLNDPELAVSLGAAAFLPKPVRREQLLQMLARHRWAK